MYVTLRRPRMTMLKAAVSVHFFRHGPEAQSVFVTFASAFLVKVGCAPSFPMPYAHDLASSCSRDLRATSRRTRAWKYAPSCKRSSIFWGRPKWRSTTAMDLNCTPVSWKNSWQGRWLGWIHCHQRRPTPRPYLVNAGPQGPLQ